jgi:hypothetical protein
MIIRGYVIVIVADPGSGAILGLGLGPLDLEFLLR